MNILFLTILSFESVDDRNIYTDLLREFIKHGHSVYVISPSERRQKKNTCIIRETNCTILRLKIGNIQKTNIVEKGISTVLLEPAYIKALKTFFNAVKFDLVLYSTPPITLVSAIEYVKKRDGAKTYLLLKDIFPQNALDIGILSTRGITGFIYKYFRKKEKRLYKVSDYIGCMSQANMEYLLNKNPEIHPNRVEVCPNSIEIIDKSIDDTARVAIRKKYGIPLGKKVFVYGGNLGKPQGVPFLISCLKRCEDINEAFFLIVGDGTEFQLIFDYVISNQPKNVKLMKRISKEDYDTLVGACDVGLVFLDHRFSIPNFPSRLLAYMQAKIPVLAVTDLSTDIGEVIVNGGFGWWCESNDCDCFRTTLREILDCDFSASLKETIFSYLKTNYDVALSYETIINRLKTNEV